MSANSLPRQIVKRALAPIVGTAPYRLMQSLAMGWDIRSGGWSEPELDFISRVVRPGDDVIDIGANYGLYAYHLSRAVGPTGRVFAFEPIPFTASAFRTISTALRMDGNVTLFEKGCGAKAERMTFNVPVQDNGAIIAGTVHMGARDNDRDGKERHARFEKSLAVECDVVTIDEALPSLRDLSLLKCDIEGADYFALRGAEKTIAKHRPLVICEINPWFLEGFGLKVEEFVGFMRGYDYQLYRYVERRLVPTPTEKVEEDNYVFIHPRHTQQVAGLL